ncbi:MAG TPA: cation:proton antiporter [Candidatus Polarisedimenticolia bacterium]|nr:cation:proton antiporter [Candidatus Polarisedimenticolia bacterium]
MHDTHEFLRSLTIVLCVAALTTVLFSRLRQPVVLGYILAGLIVGPHVPIPLIADEATVRTLSELGVILLMFSLGLEFSLRKLVEVGPTAGVAAVIQSGIMGWIGFTTGRLFGWTLMESVFAGAVVAISSTTIIAKVFDEQAIGGRLRELVVGILLVEDLIAIVLMAGLTAVGTGAGLSPAALGGTLLQLGGFLAALLAAGMLIVPRFIRMVLRLGRPETTLIAGIGICFAMAYIAQEAGYSVALGAFLAGSLVAESGSAHAVERLVEPVRDMFAAVFFVSVGLLIDPALAASHWKAVAALAAAVIVGKVASVALGAFVAGSGLRVAVQSGMSLAQIGEFSFIIASLGLSLGVVRDFLYAVAVAVSAVTTLTTPWLIRLSGPAADFVDRKLPRTLQTLSTLYGAWLDGLRSARTPRPRWRIARLAFLLGLDVALVAAVVIGTSLRLDRFAAAVSEWTSAGPAAGRGIVLAGAAVVCSPLVMGIGRLAHALGMTLASAALPKAAGKVDLDAPPRRALAVTIQFATTLIAGLVLALATQTFLPAYAGLLILMVVLAGSLAALWRSAADLDRHVRAGAEAMVDYLSRQARPGSAAGQGRPLEELRDLVHGLGEPVSLRIEEGSPAAGRSLSDLNLRGRTGATVLAISREGSAILAPPAREPLRAGDIVALVGTRESLDAARRLLAGAVEEPPGRSVTGQEE